MASTSPGNILTRIHYTAKRLQPRIEVIEGGGQSAQKEILKVLSTKYEHWSYESEMRLFIALNDRDLETGCYFANFSDKMVLKEVIVGPLSTVGSDELHDALGDLVRVEAYKARLAFKTYTVTRQRNPKMWE